MHAACQPVCLADASAGSRRAAKIAIMAMTTRSSIKVNPLVAFAAVRVFVRTIYFNVTYGKKIHQILH
jgi:hypothetical protein